MAKSNSDFSGLKQLSENIKSLTKKKQLSTSEIFTNSFISRHTKFSSFDEMLEKCGISADNQDEFEAAIPQFDVFLKEHTKFESFEKLLEEAGRIYLENQILKGLK